MQGHGESVDGGRVVVGGAGAASLTRSPRHGEADGSVQNPRGRRGERKLGTSFSAQVCCRAKDTKHHQHDSFDDLADIPLEPQIEGR